MSTQATIIEIATMSFKAGVTAQEFAKIDALVEANHVSQQPGFVARQTGHTQTGWVAIVHWTSTEAAQASMDSFATAPAAAAFMELLDPDSIVMTQYSTGA